MHRVLRVMAVVLACAAVAGCGSSSAGAPDPVSSELSYFPAGSPLVVSIATNPSGQPIRNVESLLSNYPVAAFGEAYVKSRLQQAGVNYDTDIHPLFGNPIMLGLATANGTSARGFLAAWVTRDASALGTLVHKLHAQKTGARDGATLYSASNLTIAVDGATVVLGSSQEAVTGALDRHAHGGGVSAASMRSATAGLPPNPFIEAFGDLTGVLSSARAAKARAIPWVAAIRGYGLALNASSSGLSFTFRVDTSGASLTPSELPIASTTAPPSLAGSAPIVAGMEDPAQLITFFLQAEVATDPAAAAKFAKEEATLKRQTGADVASLVGSLTGDLIIDSDAHSTIGRVAVSNPGAFSAVLARLAGLRGGSLLRMPITRGPDGFYSVREKLHTINVGVVGDELVAGEASPAQLRAFAAAPTTPPPAGSQGSVAFRIALPALIQLAVKNAPAQLQTFLASLGDVTGWVAATPRALTGQATLAVK